MGSQLLLRAEKLNEEHIFGVETLADNLETIRTMILMDKLGSFTQDAEEEEFEWGNYAMDKMKEHRHFRWNPDREDFQLEEPTPSGRSDEK